MALIHCPECGREISDQAQVCIHCGFPLPPAQDAQICIIDDVPFDFTEMLRVYHNRSRTQSVRFFNQVMEQIEGALGKDKNKQLRVYLLHQITDTGSVPARICRAEIPEQNPRDALTIGELWGELDSSGPLSCPQCGSTDVGKLEGGVSVLWNLLSTGAPKNVCRSCGHKFRP